MAELEGELAGFMLGKGRSGDFGLEEPTGRSGFVAPLAFVLTPVVKSRNDASGKRAEAGDDCFRGEQSDYRESVDRR